MTMKPYLRKFALTAHITTSVGWLGAVACFFALAIAALLSEDAQLVRGTYLAMALTGSYVIVPLCLTSLLTGLIQSLGTRWGLFQYYWVVTKFLLTLVSALILFGFTLTFGDLGNLAANTTLSIDELHNLQQSPVLHSGGGLLMLLAITTLSVYKPWSKTPYGRRKHNERHQVPQSIPLEGRTTLHNSEDPLVIDLPSETDSAHSNLRASRETISTLPWKQYVLLGILGFVLLLVITLHLTSGGLDFH